MTRRVLFVSYYFPPIAGIGSIRAARFGSHLPAFGWEPVILAPRNTPHPSDPDLRYPEGQVVRSRSLELSRLGRVLQRQDGSGGGAVTRRRPSRIRDAALRGIFPDPQIGWYPGAVVAGLRALRRRRFDVIYSSSFPITAHLVGATLSRRAGIPWVAEFRDPWSDALPVGAPRGAARALESAIANRADRVVMPGPTWATNYGERWGIDVAIVPNGHEGKPARTQPATTPILSHLGSMYPRSQNLCALWEALRRLEEGNYAEPPRVRFVGDLHPDVHAEASRRGLGHLVEATGRVPHGDAVQLIQASSILFAAGDVGSDPMARGRIPAKLFEYLATGLPILYLGDPAGDAGMMLAEHPGCYVMQPTDLDAVEAALLEALAGGTHDRNIDDLSRRARARSLAQIFDAATTST